MISYFWFLTARRPVALVPDCEQARRLMDDDPSGLWAVH
jgi:hypothetical protein